MGHNPIRFRVKYYGNNGEMLATSEVLNTRNNCKKNVLAFIKLAHGLSMEVLDLSSSGTKRFLLSANGVETPLDVM